MRLGYSYTISSYLIALTVQRLFLSNAAGDNLILLSIALLIYVLSLLKPSFLLGLIPLGLSANYTHELIYIPDLLNALDLHLASLLFVCLVMANHIKPTYTHSAIKMSLTKVKLALLIAPIVVIILLQLYYTVHVIEHISVTELIYRFTPFLAIALAFTLTNKYAIASILTTLIIAGSSFVIVQLAVIFWHQGLRFDGLFLIGLSLLCMYFLASSYRETTPFD